MPQETLAFPPAYCVIGAYRLAHDRSLWHPMWKECSQAAKRAGMAAAAWGVFTWPIQKLFVYYFMRGSAKVTGMSALYHGVVSKADSIDGSHDSRFLGLLLPSLTTFAALVFVLGQCHAIMEFWLKKKLRVCRNRAYEATVQSRGKPESWWTPYVEEWEAPPVEQAIKNTQKQRLYMRLASPLIRIFVMRVLLLPLDFVPFLGLFVSAALRSLSMGRQLHTLLFAYKKMTPLQVELWVTERKLEYRAFGFAAALLESIPILGMAFSIGNRVGAAMYAHDLEKRQQLVREGQVKRLSKSDTQTSRPKIRMEAQEGDINVPGGVFGAAPPSGSARQSTDGVPDDAPPAYSVSEAMEMVGGEGGHLEMAGGGASTAAAASSGSATRRRVPPPPDTKT